MGSNWPSIMTVWILNPLLLYKWLTWRRYCRRVAVFELVICSDAPKRMCREMVIKNCTPLTNIMSAHMITVTYFNLMKVGKEETFGGSTADGVFLDVLPFSDWMLGPRISSAPLHVPLLWGSSSVCDGLQFAGMSWGLHCRWSAENCGPCRISSHLSWSNFYNFWRRYSLAQKNFSWCCLKHVINLIR